MSFKLQEHAVKTTQVISSVSIVKPVFGQLIEPDDPTKPIACWDARGLSGGYIARINAAGKAVTSQKFKGPSLTCFIKKIPQLGQIIRIVQIHDKAVSGQLVNK